MQHHRTKQLEFFGNLTVFPALFSCSAQRMFVLESVASLRIPRSSANRWNFKSRTVNAVYETRDDLIETCCQLESAQSSRAIQEACGLCYLLDDEFLFWLSFFHKIMPHIDILYSQIQARTINAIRLRNKIDTFIEAINQIRESVHSHIRGIFATEPCPKHSSNRS